MTRSATRVEVVTIGDELLLGFTIDTNAAHLARALASIGMHIERRTTVGDAASEIAAAVGAALDRTGAVITTGGLGPTSDDLTKQSIAELFGRALRVDEAHLAWMEDRWIKRFNRPLPAANRQQAMIPDGAIKLENRHGSAPGIWLEDDRGRWVAMLPGVPREMRGMLADTLLPVLGRRIIAGTVVRSMTLRTAGVAESLLADRIDSMDGGPLGASLAYLPSIAGVDLRLTIRDVSAEDADRILAAGASRGGEAASRDTRAAGGASATTSPAPPRSPAPATRAATATQAAATALADGDGEPALATEIEHDRGEVGLALAIDPGAEPLA